MADSNTAGKVIKCVVVGDGAVGKPNFVFLQHTHFLYKNSFGETMYLFFDVRMKFILS